MAETRPCEIASSWGQPKVGKFHKWGNAVTYDDGNQPHDRTIAIVELEDGTVVEAGPKEIKFTDR